MILNCIAIDDEPLALGLICSFIAQTPFLQLTGRYSSGVDALQELHAGKTDLIFLDIQMPDLSGMELARILDKTAANGIPRIVFTTAFNHFALEGYKVDALDYLLKPFNYEEFLRAANKALVWKELVNKPGNFKDTEVGDEYLFLKAEYQLVRIAYKDILYIEGLKDYVKVCFDSGEKPLLSLISLKSLEQKLPGSRFMRVHRSYIVSLDKIRSVTRNTVQIGEISVVVGEQYREAFSRFLSHWI